MGHSPLPVRQARHLRAKLHCEANIPRMSLRCGRRTEPRGARIAVIGPAGAGKTTMCKELRDKTKLRFIEVDALFWGPGWQPISQAELFRKVAGCARDVDWILDGQYQVIHPLIQELADVVLWVDPGFWRCTCNLLKRTLSRIIAKRLLWNGNRETLVNVLSRDSVIWYSLSVYKTVIHQNETLFRGLSQGQVGLRLRTQQERSEAIERVVELVHDREAIEQTRWPHA